jgi:CubicO group peptidase (beta-lactamase class C family)
MSDLCGILRTHVGDGSVPGAVGLVARGGWVDLQAAGTMDAEGRAPMAPDSIFRIASLTKPIVAAAAMLLIDGGRITLDDPVSAWLPELAAPMVVRTPASPVEDVVPATRPVTVSDLLTFRAGWGFPSDFTLPAVSPLFSDLKQGPPEPQLVPAPDEWLAILAGIPLLYQPGEAWLYNTCSDILSVLIARVSGQPLPEFLAARLFEPLGMVDTGFAVPAGKLGRFTSLYQATSAGGLELVDGPGGQWSSLPAFPAGSGGLVSTAADLCRFGQMLLADGSVAGRKLLSAYSVRQMLTDHLTPAQRAASRLFLEGQGQGWGFGGSVDVEPVAPWNVPGRYGWVGGTGTAAHIVPATGTVTILLTQVNLAGPAEPAILRDFWQYAAG